MKKQNLLILFLGVFFLGFSVISCSKSDDPGQDQDDDQDDDLVEVTSEYLQGSGYHLIALDETSKTKIASKVVKDYRTDDVNSHLYIWEETYEAGVSNGPNAFGEVEEWTSLVVTTAGWSGGGFAVSVPEGDATIQADFSGVGDDYVLHFAIKSQGSATHQIIVAGVNETAVPITLGSEAFEGVEPYANFPRDGEWHHIEIPVSYLKDQGLVLNTPFNGNTFTFLSGGVTGTTLEIDGIFYYKPK